MFITQLMKIPQLVASIAPEITIDDQQEDKCIKRDSQSYSISNDLAKILVAIRDNQYISLVDVRKMIDTSRNGSQNILAISSLIYWSNLIVHIRGANQAILLDIECSSYGSEEIKIADESELETSQLTLSRFAVLKRDGQKVVLQKSLNGKRFIIRDSSLKHLIFDLLHGTKLSQLLVHYQAQDKAAIILVLRLLLAESLLAKFSSDQPPDPLAEGSEVEAQWSITDLQFHAKSRLGYHFGDFGGAFPFVNIIEPRPAIRELPEGKRIDLYRPDIATLIKNDASLTQIQIRRMSIRQYDEENPINLKQLGEFLYRTARVTFESEMEVTSALDPTQKTNMGLAWHPYPTGGASYELEIYLTVDRAADLDPGMYYYAPKTHQLIQVSEKSIYTQSLIETAFISCAQIVKPQVLIHVACRFQRVSWKYHAIAYATNLRNTGVLYQTFYLNAIAMGIAPCGLGSGNIKDFALASKNDPLIEGNIGEFMLGSLPKNFNFSDLNEEVIAQFHQATLAKIQNDETKNEK